MNCEKKLTSKWSCECKYRSSNLARQGNQDDYRIFGLGN